MGFGKFKMGMVIVFQPGFVGLGSSEVVGIGMAYNGSDQVFDMLRGAVVDVEGRGGMAMDALVDMEDAS